jgi:hypothetical protein
MQWIFDQQGDQQGTGNIDIYGDTQNEKTPKYLGVFQELEF